MKIVKFLFILGGLLVVLGFSLLIIFDRSNGDNLNIINVTGIDIVQSEISLDYCDIVKLVTAIYPTNATNRNLEWTSSDGNLVSVDANGNITAKQNKNGEVMITVRTIDGNYIDTVKVTVIASKNTDNPNSSDNPNISDNPGTSSKPNVSVTGITLNKSDVTLHLNATKKVTLIPTISPSDATDKSLSWSSSDTSIATVSNGVVTAKNPGVTNVTVTTKDGSYTDSVKVTVKKNVIYVIGASQVAKMRAYKRSYSSKNYNYNLSDGTLNYIYESGSGIPQQYGNDFNSIVNSINSLASNKKKYVNFYIFFPIPGNTIKSFACSEIVQTNTKINEYVTGYKNVIKNLVNKEYSVKGYVVSAHPVQPAQATDNDKVVSNTNANSCAVNYRSNRKYYKFNLVMKKHINNLNVDYLQYKETFTKIMDITNVDGAYSYKMSYNTTDGIHWDKNTTIKYVDMMFGSVSEL